MKKFFVPSICVLVAAIAMVMTTTCVGLFHEPEMPEELKK
jgi:cyclic lactone autoinducer peptide